MLARLALLLVVFAASSAYSQVQPGATGGAVTDNDSGMMTPPPVSGDAYPSGVGNEGQANYFSTGVTASGGYIDNFFPSLTSPAQNDATSSASPTFALTRSTPRQEESLSYNPSFIFYEPDSGLDTIDQGATVAFQYRFSPTFTLALHDSFYETSNVFDESYTFSNGGVTGSTQSPQATVIAPFSKQLSNFANGFVSYQFGRDGMIGGGGSYSTSEFPDSVNLSGFSNSNGIDAAVFYSRRLSSTQYAGIDYHYGRITSELATQQSDTQISSLLPFYTVYFSRKASISISVGIQRVNVVLPEQPATIFWSPTGVISAGWHNQRLSLAANYNRTVTSGGGLFGAYDTNNASASGNWMMARAWTIVLTAAYASTTNLSQQSSLSPANPSISGGTSISGQVSASHELGEHINTSFGYERLHQEYSGIPLLGQDPNCDQVYGRISYTFKLPLGR